jgi:hypothetical protein
MKKRLKQFACATVALAGATATAGEMAVTSEQPVPEAAVVEEKSLCDTIFGMTTLYEGDNPYIQEFKLVGRYHGQYFYADADEQGDAEYWDTRRWRLGFAMDFLNDFAFEVNFNLEHENGGRFFEDIEDMSLDYSGIEGVDVAIGKMKPTAGREYNTSSKRIKTIERSLVSNQVFPDKIWGLAVGGEINGLDVDLGAYAGDLDGDWNFSEFDAGYLLNAAVTWNDVRLSYLYNDGDAGNSGAEDYDHIFSLSYVNYGKKGYEGLGFFAEAIYAVGDESDDVWGITLMPSHMLTDKLEGVLRLHVAGSEGDSGLTVQRRYDRQVDALSSNRGDQYVGAYAGLNYYLCGDNLKLMGGVEYGNFDQDNGDSLDVLSVMGGVRIYF